MGYMNRVQVFVVWSTRAVPECFLGLRWGGVQRQEASAEQLTPEGILNSLKKAQAPPQVTQRVTGVPDAASSGPVQRPNVRKRFERVMASQISTLNHLISSAALAGDPQAGDSRQKPPEGS